MNTNTERATVSGAPMCEVHSETVVTTERDTESNANLEVSAVAKPKLPKITLPRFSGEITKFRVFWDRFQSAVDNNTSISSVDKFNYLHALVEGPAARSIQGLQLTEANYKAAKQILQERFGKLQQVISAHMEELLKLPVCKGEKTSQFHHIYDKVQVNVRGLEALGIESEQYGSFLVPVIMAKLPSEVRLQIARTTTNDIWKIEELLRIIQGEVEAREMSDFMRTNERRPEPTFHRNNTSTTSVLTGRDNTSGGRVCVYCKGDTTLHHVIRCPVFNLEEIFSKGRGTVFCAYQMAIEFHSVTQMRNAENVSKDIINQFVKQQGAIPMQVNTNVSNSNKNTTQFPELR